MASVTYTTSNVGAVDSNGILWKATQVGKFTDKLGDCASLWDSLQKSVARNGARQCAGKRDILNVQTDAKGFEFLALGDYQWLTYSQYFDVCDNFGAGLPVKIPSLQKGDTVVIYAETQLEWMQCAFGCWRQGLTVGTIYATLGEEGALFGINQSKCKAVVADARLFKVLAKICDKFTFVKDIIALEPPPEEHRMKLEKAGLTIHTMEEVKAAGKTAGTAPSPAAADEIAVLMYTSGTTGNPKGVLISHGSVLATMAGTLSDSSAIQLNGKSFLTPDTVYLAYLPLAHIMELAVEVSMFSVGAKVGFGSPGTLTPTGAKMQPGQTGDAAMLAPTVFVAAPAVLDRVLIAVKAKFKGTSKMVQGIVESGLASGKANYLKGGVGTKHCIARLVFKKVQKLLGGRVSLMLTGSAPLAAEVQMFVQTVFGCVVRQGYGLTETCAATCIALASDNATLNVGPPQESACIKLRDWEEGGYRNADLDDTAISMRRGEVLIGGPTVCSGYLVDPTDPDPDIVAKNESDFVVIDGTRYFCTGDIGQFTPTGNLQIIDRKKDLVKLQMGEYVALSKVENVLKSSKYTALPMAYALSSMSYVIALICPNKKPLSDLAASLGITGDLNDLEMLCKNEQVIAGVLADVQAESKTAKLSKHETPTKVILISELWTPENDMLTAVQKLKRRQIVDKHKAEIDAKYV